MCSLRTCAATQTDNNTQPSAAPAFLMKALGNIASLFSPAAANIFKLNYLAATVGNTPDCRELAEQLSIKLVSAEEYLGAKLR